MTLLATNLHFLKSRDAFVLVERLPTGESIYYEASTKKEYQRVVSQTVLDGVDVIPASMMVKYR